MTTEFAPKISYRLAATNVHPMYIEDNPKGNWPDDLYDYNGRYNLPYGWAGELTYVNTMGFELHYQLYRDIVEHINACVKNPEQNAVWNKMGDCIYVMFRKKKDLTWFKIRFGA